MSKIWKKKRWKEYLKVSRNGYVLELYLLKLQSYNLAKSEFFFRGGGEVCAPQHTHVTRL